MRVAQLEISRSLLSNLGSLNEDLSKYSSQLSSGKLLNHLSDSPSSSAQLVSLTKLEAEIDQYDSNTNTGNLYLGVTQSALNEVNNLVTTIYTKGSQAASSGISDDTRAALAYEARALRDQILAVANTAVRGRFIFSGSLVTDPPFVLEGNTITYQGDSSVNTLSVDTGTNVQMNYSGDAVFNSIFASINSLLTAMDANDTAGIQTALNQISPALADMLSIRARVGSNLSTLENVQARLESRKTSLTEQRSAIEDADMAEAAVQLKQTQTALDAAMSTASSVLTQRNLFDILG
jgi:flagellar hook-associated protein 3 FlgL